jgi:hypothetical protein
MRAADSKYHAHDDRQFWLDDINAFEKKKAMRKEGNPCANRYHAIATNTNVNADISTVTHTMRLKSDLNSGRYSSAPGEA